MINKMIKILIIAALIFTAFLIYTLLSPRLVIKNEGGKTNFELKLATTTLVLPLPEIETIVVPAPEKAAPARPAPQITAPKLIAPAPVKEVSSKSFEELVNGSLIQLYCGYLSANETNFTSISRGTGIIISSKGEILTNRHIIYDENMKKARPDCFVLKSPFPNSKSEKPKIYYSADIISYPLTEKISETFSKDKYYNDFAILKVNKRPAAESKIAQLLQTSYATDEDYAIMEIGGVFNYLPIDWAYNPKNNDQLITLGYGIDAAHIANQITSTVGRLSGNIDINETRKPQILLIESNATQGFSGGALINPKSKGLIGLISWITSGDEIGKYTVAIFRDFLIEMMLNELDFNLKAL
ncbi:MAG: hypothetical protein UV48_C0001G0014 [Candidatus Azambacteria bacterium GW2011_GWA2_42_9]|uniref:Peptidase S1 and S6 chymotrypsin/Hap n=3 Tax=Candidatus Azamiibacteriota TaxID=1752741 RepID=A0A0G1C8Q4_9BACT|nr:MAG: hypothetical protein UV07_C0008G0021 [Candidatus Azambacteria bacterium GW2011_GWB1_42_17]KKS46008.1 MAG: hypothetical protein UV10_C0009G0011 [Candidatus Azambacteria bacterium GW2011_GWA1_42_19]KKS76142.1 MAG: hypothetical protein UV48_C0001G0014 [Candidatus Azambacteria bacterium GW2011_GWA2_42_9]KKS88227.1 MAG: hypothetical protein UV62_C0011G0023 [Parcubacteria group bacterium GW2011_GWC1_43_11]